MSDLVAARIGAQVAIFAFKARLNAEKLVGLLLDAKA